MSCKYSYLSSGSVYVREAGSSDPFRALGNTASAVLGAEEETFELKNYQSASGGLCSSVRRISKVTLSLTCHAFSPENLALATFGSTDAVVGGTAISNEAAIAGNGLIATAQPIDGSQSVTVTDGAVTTYVEGDDYEIRQPMGIYIPDTSSIPDGPIEISYTTLGSDIVKALTESGKSLEIVFEGVNGAENKAVGLRIYKAQFGPASNISVITGDDFGSLEFSADVLADSSKGAGESQFYQWTYEQ